MIYTIQKIIGYFLLSIISVIALLFFLSWHIPFLGFLTYFTVLFFFVSIPILALCFTYLILFTLLRFRENIAVIYPLLFVILVCIISYQFTIYIKTNFRLFSSDTYYGILTQVFAFFIAISIIWLNLIPQKSTKNK